MPKALKGFKMQYLELNARVDWFASQGIIFKKRNVRRFTPAVLNQLCRCKSDEARRLIARFTINENNHWSKNNGDV